MPQALSRQKLAYEKDPEARLSRLLGAAFADYRRRFREAEAGRRPDFPLHLDVDVATACNFRCPMCPAGAGGHFFPGFVPGLFLDRSLYRLALAEGAAGGLCSLRLGLTGEPSLAEDIHLWAAEARAAGLLDISLITNGSRLTPERSRALIEAGLTRLMISVDAARPATYARVRPGGSWDELRKNIDDFLEVRAGLGSELPLLRLSFVEMKSNLGEREEFTALFAPLADYLGFQRYQNILGRPETDFAAPGPALDGYCADPYARLALQADGGLFPCCSDFGRRAPLGRLPENTLREVWNSEPARRLAGPAAAAAEPCRLCRAASEAPPPTVTI